MKDPQEVAERARRLVRRLDAGVLSTHSKEHAGYPFGSITPYVLMPNGAVVIYISAIAQHTHNILADPKLCLTLAEPASDSQASGRVTILGDAAKVEGALAATIGEHYYTFFDSARAYANTHDFSFFEIQPIRVRYIQGFGSIHWVEPQDWVPPVAEWLGSEAGIISHMNDDHADSLVAMCQRFTGDSSDTATMLSLDPNGFHVRTASDIHYLSFDVPCLTSVEVRKEMVRLSKLAKA